MYIAGFLIFLVLLFFGVIYSVDLLAAISSIAIFILIILIVGSIFEVGTSKTIDEEIKIYQEENFRLEESINLTIRNQLKDENFDFEKIEPKNYIALTNIFPELSFNVLLIEQIKKYEDNWEQIKLLEIEKNNMSKKKFLLYFGK